MKKIVAIVAVCSALVINADQVPAACVSIKHLAVGTVVPDTMASGVERLDNILAKDGLHITNDQKILMQLKEPAYHGGRPVEGYKVVSVHKTHLHKEQAPVFDVHDGLMLHTNVHANQLYDVCAPQK